VVVLKREVGIKQYEINTLKTEFEKLKKEKDAFDFKIEKFDKALKDLDQLLESQITDKSKKGLGYSVVPLPHPLIYNRPNKLDLSYSGLDEFKKPKFKGYGLENSKKESDVVKESDNSKKNSDKSLVKEQESHVKSSFVEGCGSNTSKNVSEVEPKKVRKNNDAPIIKDWVSDDEEQDESMTKPEKKTVIPTAAKIEKPVKKSVRYAEMYRSQRPRGNQRNWNGQKSNQLGSEFVMYNKACFNCGSFKHVQKNCTYHQKKKVVSGNNYNRVDNYYYAKTSHHRTHKNVTPRAVLLRTGLKPLSTAKSVYTAHPKPTVHYARPKTHFFKSAQSTVQRPFYKNPALTNRHFNHNVNTIRPRIVNTARFNAVKPSACWVWRPIKPNSASITLNRYNYIKAIGQIQGKPQHDDKGFVDSGCSRHMTRKQHRASCKSKVRILLLTVVYATYDLFGPRPLCISLMHKKYYLVVTDDYSRFTWVFFLTTKDETSEILKLFIKEIENLVDKKVKIIRSDNGTGSNNGTEFKNKVIDDFCREKGIKKEYNVARTPQQNSVAERRNRTLIEAARTMLADSKLPTTFWAEAVNSLGKFDGKSDEGFFVRCSLSSKAFRVYNTRTRRVEENLHIGFLENKPMIEGNGPKWLFDIDSLTQSMNYVPIAAGTISNESAGIQEEFNAGTSTQKEEISQDCIVMPIWKDASYFDSPSKVVGNVEPKSATDDQKQVEDGLHNESDENDKSDDDSSPKEVNIAGQHVNTTSPAVNTGHFKLNTIDPSVNTTSSYDQDSPKDMLKTGASHTLESTHVEFFSDEDEPEVDLGNIINSYTVPPISNTRIHKDHPITNVIGDVKSSIQTKRMTKPTSEQGFLSVVYEQKTHDTLNTY
ncbi:putative ribonuclease H-like domain-containing protein, partial [Tanacetum coccineum]